MALSAPSPRSSRRLWIPAAAAVAGFVCLTLRPAYAQGGFEGPGIYEIVNQNSGKVVDLDRNDETTVIQFESRGTDNQRWEFREAGGGWYYIVNTMNSRALEPAGTRKRSPVEGRPFQGGESQQWRLEPGRRQTALILHRTGLALDVPGDSRKNGVRLQVTSKNGSAAQRFLLKRVSFAPGFGTASPPGHLEHAQGTPAAYEPVRACQFAVQERVRSRYGARAYLVFYGEPKRWRQDGKDRVYGQADVRGGGRRDPIAYNCLGDPRAGRIEWSGLRLRERQP